MDLDGRVLTCVFPGFVIVQTYVPCSTWPEKKIEPEKSRARHDGRRTFDLELRRHLLAVELQYRREVLWTGDQNVTLNPKDVWDTLQAMRFVDSYHHFHSQHSSDDHKSTSSDRIPCHRRAPEKSQDKGKATVIPNGRAAVNSLMRDILHGVALLSIRYRIPVRIPEFLHVPRLTTPFSYQVQQLRPDRTPHTGRQLPRDLGVRDHSE